MSRFSALSCSFGVLALASAAVATPPPGTNPPPYGSPYYLYVGYATARYCAKGENGAYSFSGYHASAFRFTSPTAWQLSQNNAPIAYFGQIGHGTKGYVHFYLHNPSADEPGEPITGVWYPYSDLHLDPKWVLCEDPLPGVE